MGVRTRALKKVGRLAVAGTKFAVSKLQEKKEEKKQERKGKGKGKGSKKMTVAKIKRKIALLKAKKELAKLRGY